MASGADWHLPVAEGFTDKAIIKTANQISNQAFEEIAQKLELRGIRTPLSQIIGFAQNQAQAAPQVIAIETTTSTGYVDLATAGPQLTGLSDGQYLIFGSAVVKNNTAGNLCIVSLSINGAAAADSDGAMASDDQYTTAFFLILKTLAGGGNNTLTMKYVVTAGTGSFRQRRLVAVRISN